MNYKDIINVLVIFHLITSLYFLGIIDLSILTNPSDKAFWQEIQFFQMNLILAATTTIAIFTNKGKKYQILIVILWLSILFIFGLPHITTLRIIIILAYITASIDFARKIKL